MTLSLPQDKLARLKDELKFFRGRRRCTKKQLTRLCGILNHCAKVVRGGRTFSRRLIEQLKGLPQGPERIYLDTK